MATKKTCDRCGAVIPYGAEKHYAGISRYRYEGKLQYELCPTCAKHLREWLDGKEGDNNAAD